MAVRAKFFVTERAEQASGSTKVTLSAVARGEDNKKWAAYTPNGQISMTILNEVASDQFKPGTEFYVDFTEAPKGLEGMGES